MKKFIILLCVALAAVFALSGCNLIFSKMPDPAAQITGLDLSDCKEVTTNDTHGGFLGDGESFYTYKFTDDAVKKEVKANARFTNTPSDELLSMFYGDDEGALPKADSDDNPFFPETDNGYYFFYDRHDEAQDRYDISAIDDRYSYNYSLALFDANTNTLYYYECDT